MSEKNKHKTPGTKPPGNHTNNKNLQDQQRAYEEEVSRKRGIPSNRQEEKNTFDDEFRSIGHSINKQSDNFDLQKSDDEHHVFAEDGIRGTQSNKNESFRNIGILDNNSFDHTQNKNLQDQQRAYEDGVNRQRGIPSRRQEENNTLSNEFRSIEHSINKQSDNFDLQKSDDEHHVFAEDGIRGTQSNSFRNVRIPNNNFFDHTQNKNLQDAQRSYKEEIDQKHGISFNPNNCGKTKIDNNYRGLIGESESDKKYYVSRVNLYRGVSEKNIQNRRIDLSELYESSSRGAERNSDFTQMTGVSEEDFSKLLTTRGLQASHNVAYKIADGVSNFVTSTGSYLYETSTANTDSSRGLKKSKEMVDPITFLIIDSSLRSMDKAMKSTLSKELNQLEKEFNVFGADHKGFLENEEIGLNSFELEAVQKELIGKLQGAGHMQFSTKGKIAQKQIRDYLKNNAGKLAKSEEGALKILMLLSKNKTIEDSMMHKRRIFKNKMIMRSFRQLQGTDTGAGTLLAYNMIRRGHMTLMLGLKAVLTARKMVALAGKLALRSTAWMAAKLAKTKLAEKIAETKLGNVATKGFDGIRKGINFINNTRLNLGNKLRNSRLGKMMNAIDGRFKKFQQFRRDPFNLKFKRRKLLAKIKNSKLMTPINKVFSPINILKRAIGHLLATVMAAVSYLISILMMVALLALVTVLACVIVISIVQVIMGAFDFSLSEKEIRDKALEKIADCYENTQKEIEGLYGGQYGNVSVTYEAVRDDEEYEKENHKPSEPFIETTNSAEMLSMAQVYFDFDLKEAGKDKVLEYIRKLYNGSHLLTIIEKPVWGEDEEGNPYIVETNVDATLETYYFNDIFECQLMDQPNYANIGSNAAGTILAGTTITPPQGLGTHYTYMGWQMITSKSSMQYKLREKAGMKFDAEGFGIINGRYVIACTTTFGQVGDYIDFYLKNGEILKCIIGDIKRQTDKGANMWGHDAGKCMIEFVVDKSTWYKNGKGNHSNPGTVSCHPEWKSFVTKAVNGGNYFTNPNGPTTFPAGSGTLLNPCPSARVSSEFGPRKPPTTGASKYHNGIDLAASSGTPILASSPGKVISVVSAANGGARGNYIKIDHGNGIVTLYQHMKSRAIPNVGDTIQQGQKIGEVGNTGIGTGPHLHFEVHVNGKPVNPRNHVNF